MASNESDCAVWVKLRFTIGGDNGRTTKMLIMKVRLFLFERLTGREPQQSGRAVSVLSVQPSTTLFLRRDAAATMAHHATVVVTWPANEMLMTPPQLHVQVEELFRAGTFPIMTVGDPGAQGAAVTGTQGIGVRTPNAAVVAADTLGLDKDWHIPNVGIFRKGAKSMMVAAGAPQRVRRIGRTLSAPGAIPNEQVIKAPEVTSCPMGGSTD